MKLVAQFQNVTQGGHADPKNEMHFIGHYKEGNDTNVSLSPQGTRSKPLKNIERETTLISIAGECAATQGPNLELAAHHSQGLVAKGPASKPGPAL